MTTNIDNLNAPQYVDFENMREMDDIDKFFDVDHERERQLEASRRDTFEVLVPTTPQIQHIQQQEQRRISEGNKENCTPPFSNRKRHHSMSGRAGNVLADISLTPGTSKRKSQVAYMGNGRSVLVQSYDGIEIMTPNKTHLMETRLDAYMKSPGLALRTRSVTREQQNVSGDNLNASSRKSRRQHYEAIQLIENTEVVEAVKISQPIVASAPVVSETQSSSIASETVALIERPLPPRYRAPMVVPHPQKINSHYVKPVEPVKAVKFMSTAEQIRNFQKNTPERFHSRPVRSALQSKLQINRTTSAEPRPNTIPKSPFLVTKMRQNTRHVETKPTLVEKEEQDLEEMKKHPIRAHPVPRHILVPFNPKNVVHPKTPTKPSPFNLSKGKRKEPTPSPVFRFKAHPVPHEILKATQGVPEKHQIPLTEPKTPNLLISSKYPKRIKMELPGSETKEIVNFGVHHTKNVSNHHVTRVQPFSFEERDRKIKEHKEELLQKQVEEERKAREFKASKKPTFSTPTLPARQPLPPTRPRTPQLSALKYGAEMQHKFQHKVEHEQQEEKKAAQFHARPATVTHKKPFEPILPNRKITVGEVKLSTELRAAERAAFNEKLRREEAKMMEDKAKLEALLEEKARAERALLRREAEFKATDLRISSPFKILPSDKPLTEPISPKFSERLTHSLHQQ